MTKRLLASALAFASTAAAAQGPGWGPWGWWPFGALHMLWWVLIVVGIVGLVAWLAGGSGWARSHGNRALEILKERYARGEINRDEFEQRKRDLAA